MSEHRHPYYRDPAWWDGYEQKKDAELAPFQGLPFEQVTEDVRTELLGIVLRQLYELRVVAKSLALEGQPKQSHERRQASNTTGDGGNEG